MLAAERETPIRAAQTLKAVAPAWAKELSRPVFRTYGHATSRQRPPPDYLIIGTKRGGSTSMFKYLNQHPNVLPMWPGVENAKKTYFFDRNFHRGLDWYRAHFPTSAQRTRVARETGSPAITGEAAVNYMFMPQVFERVRATLPNVRLIVLLRNPVDRIWSHYHERVTAGTETLSFRDALAAEEERTSGEAAKIANNPRYVSERLDWFSYRARGRYLEHLAPWLDAFFPHQLLVIRSEDMYAMPGRTVVDVQRFLGLPERPPEAPHRFNQGTNEPMPPEVKAELAEYYRPHVRALEARLGRSMGWSL